MSITSQSIIPAVTKVLNLLGDVTVFTRVVPGAYDPTTGAVGTGTTSTYSAKGVSDNFNTQEIDGETIQMGDMKYTLMPPANNIIPAINDTCVVAGITYRVINVLNDNLQGQIYLFTLQLRI